MRVLVIGIHPDDVELGCGGTVAVCSRSGYDVAIVDLSRGESASNGTPEQRAEEARSAATALGCRKRLNLGLPDAGIRADDADQQRAVVGAIRTARPQVVLAPFADDPHPDHASGGALVERALYLAGIHGYASPSGAPPEAWRTPTVLVYSGRREVTPHVVVDITPVHDTKLKAIRAHESQFTGFDGANPTPLNAPDFLSAVEARDRTHGHLIGVGYGEAFAARVPIALTDLSVFAPPAE